MLNRPLSSNLFSSRTCLLFQATPIWMEERKGKGAGFVSLLSRYKTSRRNEFSRDRSIDQILRDELDGEVVRRNKSRKLSWEKGTKEGGKKRKIEERLSSNLRDIHRQWNTTRPANQSNIPFTFPVNRSMEKNVSALADIASQTTRQRPSKKEDILFPSLPSFLPFCLPPPRLFRTRL